jgi:hypothetical protein
VRACIRTIGQESKQRDAEALNELTDNLEYYRQREVSDAAASAAAAAIVAPAVAPAVDHGEPGRAEAGSSEQELSLPPSVGMVEIVKTGSGSDEYTGQEYTTYVMRCTAGAADTAKQASDAHVHADARPSDDTTGAATPPPPVVSPPVGAKEWTVSKRFSDFSKLRAELVALPTIGAVVETMDFPPSTWNFLPWGAGKLDQVRWPFPYLYAHELGHCLLSASSRPRVIRHRVLATQQLNTQLFDLCARRVPVGDDRSAADRPPGVAEFSSRHISG